MSSTSDTFRVFVSSTFADLRAERDALQQKVWPELAKLCGRSGFRFQAVDLRWGISEEAGLDQQTARICLQELKRCQDASPRPNFVILLGNRYGWRPLPAAIDAEEFEALVRQSEAVEQQLIREWYVRDDNQLPPVYTLRPRNKHAPDEANSACWTTTVERRLRAVLTRNLDAVLPPQDARRVKYECSLTEQEILAGALRPGSASNEHVFAYFREADALLGLDPNQAVPEMVRPFVDCDEQSRIDVDARERLLHLKSRIQSALGESQVRTFTANWNGDGISLDHLESLCERVLADLSAVIQAEIAKHTAIPAPEAEVAAHRRIGQERGSDKKFHGRSELLARIAAYLDGTEPQRPLFLVGPAGSGKSALTARAACEAARRLPQAVIVQRFIGATPQSQDIRFLLHSVCEELGWAFRLESPPPHEFRELSVELTNRLANATEERPVLLLLDAVDQLSDAHHARSLRWLKRELPPHVRVVVSVLTPADAEDSDAPRTEDDLATLVQSIALPEDILSADDYSTDDASVSLEMQLRAVDRTLTETQRVTAADAFARCPRPLFLHLLAAEAARWRSHDSDVSLPEADSSEAMLHAMIDRLYDRLSSPSQHGALLVDRALGYLAAAKNGLAEDELLEVLSRDEEFFTEFLRKSEEVSQPLPAGTTSLPTAVWARLFADLQPYLTVRRADGANLLAFYHRSLEEVARTRYLGSKDIAVRRHRGLADYFTPEDDNGFFQLTLAERQAWAKHLPPTPRPVNLRRVSELPYHLLEVAKRLGRDDPRSASWNAVTSLFLNIHFLEAKAEAVF